MSQLDDIKARAEKAREARRNYAGETEAESVMLALVAEQSSYDVPKLVAALEAADEKLQWLSDMFRSRAAKEGGDTKYTGYALGAMEALVEFRGAISEALS